MTKINKWLQSRKDLYKLALKERDLLDAAKTQEIPDDLRPATAKDIVEGNIIWYKHDDYDQPFWNMVEYVERPNDNWKAYTAHDGCRYGLDDAFVEVK